MAIYGRINDTSSLKGLYNGNEISYQSIQLPSWLEEKDKKNFLRFYDAETITFEFFDIWSLRKDVTLLWFGW